MKLKQQQFLLVLQTFKKRLTIVSVQALVRQNVTAFYVLMCR